MDSSNKDKTETSPETPDNTNDLDSLEGSSTVVTSDTTTPKPLDTVSPDKQPPKPLNSPRSSPISKLTSFAKRTNLYLLLFVFVLLIASLTIFVSIYRQKKGSAPPSINSQSLSPNVLSGVSGGNTTIGTSNQLLTIQSATTFNSLVTVKNNLDVAGNLQVGKALSIPSVIVNGTGTFNQLQATSLTVSGNTTIQGQLIVPNGITVAGAANFSGTLSAPQLSVNSLTLNGNLAIDHHITTNGSIPKISSAGSAVSSISGTDTAGTVTINLGAAGSSGTCYASVTFSQAFGNTPHLVISPSSSAAAAISYYVGNLSSTGFSICGATSQTSGQAIFDYIAVD